MITNKAILTKSFLISFLYVGSGFFCLLGLYPSSPLYFDSAMLGVTLTFPVSIIGFLIMYTEADYIWTVIIQTGVFLLFWLIVYRVLLKRHKKKRIEKKITEKPD